MPENNPVSNLWARRIIEMWKFYKGLRGDNLRRTGDSAYIGSDGGSQSGVNTDWRPRQFLVKQEENDYLVCVPYSLADEVEGTKEVKVAKPISLRGDDELWSATPGYVLDTSVIWAAPLRNNGAVDADSVAITMQDMNIDGRSAAAFWAKITGSTADDTNKWTYAFTEWERTASGWQSKTGGRSGSGALNSVEASNDGTGIQGNSIDIDGTVFDDNTGLEIQPVQGEPIVRMTAEVLADGTEVYSFEYVNAVDGECA